MCAAPATAIEYIAPAPAVSYVAPAPSVDVHGARKSALLSPNAPEIFEFECGRGSSLHPLPRRRRRLADDEMLPELYEIDEDEMWPEVHDIADRGFEEAANNTCNGRRRTSMESRAKSNDRQRLEPAERYGTLWRKSTETGKSRQHRKR